MKATPTFNVTGAKSEVDIATARVLLEHAPDMEELSRRDEPPDRARHHALNEVTGAFIHVPPMAPPGDPAIPVWDMGHLVFLPCFIRGMAVGQPARDQQPK